MPDKKLKIDLAYRPRLADLKPLNVPAALLAQQPQTLAAPRTTPASELKKRQGYAENFLGDFVVPWPAVDAELAADVYPLDNTGNRLDYTHFSITMSRSRRLALYVGVNIDGASSVEVKRGKDAWSFDGRLPAEAQIGESVYADNLLDRGHLVRRQDPNWGKEAEVANGDTFHFTNCSPQMAAFNQKTWLELEDYILENTRRWKSRVTVFSGPVLRDDDRSYRNIRVPSAFWKVVAFVGDDGKPSASAYMIDQSRELGQLDIMFGQLRTWQRSVLQIEQLTGIHFGALASYDGFSNEERLTGTRIEARIRGPQDIRV
ncbi:MULTISPECIES: DNA/RNA non-specific endonuclease [Pseudomonas syringae group]|uniref:DNA/RNA non-specific endonuclease n=1 Tax=Pseudomonas syringae pv. delphinii TaxID=192088 RepID=A0A3M4C933_9PSED|nr:DNA/RNA non-specific endonuclease [Pseudomonas syringae group genomosp. 3]NAT21395.1 DNA/RNA non-specific endonuclease [Pseudomonas syringae pv. actinidifoliorum]NAT39181.1 DNA/RNA non-specific endonuclease [Pseudomonas syringae pv. actinidifoliorum]POD80961.1 endonuclease [Pseudomonas syringae group genomosp. 3]RMP08398.1 DNA/RNA non-specific endonuclease [Pseudomonas syringae pv. delphinii]RMP27962.1 DNA/RNA non-specific endonuclease [Pseudomonas syringae pv. delphinii]